MPVVEGAPGRKLMGDVEASYVAGLVVVRDAFGLVWVPIDCIERGTSRNAATEELDIEGSCAPSNAIES